MHSGSTVLTDAPTETNIGTKVSAGASRMSSVFGSKVSPATAADLHLRSPPIQGARPPRKGGP